ncbi:S-layer homology domain-containing protein [Paenibacillus illinoisensis]|uniref:S-layer homology domain-containing protein n=1 Tax=Paenibacillus illinoisensis TaxID=59845 RepID=UPI001C8D2A31|nr:S-layer homology domain-containing protein [Paenibacillus illinoisensis]MBY0217284.1 S-layer homology domain-containing protein [Paenibacillus illinoisensis]
MRQAKRPLIWMMLAAMVLSLFPAGLLKQNTASAADLVSSATYFIPDLAKLSNTSSLTLDKGTNQLSRENVYQTTNPTMTITGTFSYVSSSTMSVKIEQMNSSTNAAGDTVWTPDATRFTTGTVTPDTTSTNKFNATNLTLFSGFNRITFYGNQGSVERSDTFYVLYDKVPYLQSLKVYSGTNSYNLNEGAQTVVSTKAVSIQGAVQNATKVTVSVNGESALLSSLLEDGKFFTPQMNLKPGLNSLKFIISNASDTITATRDVYYYDAEQPFAQLDIVNNGSSYALIDNEPTLTSSVTNGTFTIEALLPASASPRSFEDVGTVSVNNSQLSTTLDKSIISEKVIPGPDGMTAAYRLVKFTTNSYDFSTDSDSGLTEQNQKATVTLTYGTYTASYEGEFDYLPGEKVITNMYYLPDYDADAKKVVSKVALKGAQVDESEFYIMVEASTNLADTDELIGAYLPLATSKLTLIPEFTDGKTQVYKVSGFATGEQNVRFQFGSTAKSFYNATISFSAKSYIYVSSIYDGQTYTFNSKETEILELNGQYIGFEGVGDATSSFNAQIFINGVDYTPTSTWITKGTGTNGKSVGIFNEKFDIKRSGPIVYGENTIVLTGTTADASGHTMEIRKEMRIYVIDSNVSNIDSFMPTLIPNDSRQAFTHEKVSAYTTTELANIFSVTSDFVYNTDKYVTSEESYDLVFRGGGADIINLKFGSDVMFTSSNFTDMHNGTSKIYTGQFTFKGKIYNFDYAGDTDEFMIRIKGVEFEAPGSHVYTLELINSTGARSTQRLEIVREASSYRVIAPQPTVGDKIVVNKNFVRFDIEAEGATQVLVDKAPATKRNDIEDRFVYDYVGLKANKTTSIKIQVIRDGATVNDTIDVYYTDTVNIDSQYMAPKVANKYSVFNKGLELTFPKGTVLESANQVGGGVTKFYPDNKLLFGIADPKDGVVERRNDYGNIINVNADARSENGESTIIIPDNLVLYFNSTLNTSNFTLVSDIYWINGGIGEQGNKGDTGYKAGTNGLPPYYLDQLYFTQIPAERKLVPSNRGTLKLNYDSTIVDEVGSTITVFKYTDKGVWENIGGEVDTNKHTITVPFDEFGYYKVMKLSKSYTDITNHPWGRNLLNALYSKGIMNNLRYNEFGSDDQTTRGEFATLLVKGLSLPLNYDNNQTFYDIVPTSTSTTWDYASIETAARAGIVQGLSDGFFGADQRVTREQAAVMIARAMSLKLSANDSKLSAKLAKSFTDSAAIDYYARPAIEAVNKQKIMEGNPVTVAGSTKALYQFNPKGNLTRAEASKIAVELLKKSTKLFPKNLS